MIRPLVTQRTYGLLSGRVTLAIDDWDAEIAAFGRNLAQKHYFTSSVAWEAAGWSQLNTGEPRTIGIQFTKRFGSIN
jgi:iron complex outermembrane recepter protein